VNRCAWLAPKPTSTVFFPISDQNLIEMQKLKPARRDMRTDSIRSKGRKFVKLSLVISASFVLLWSCAQNDKYAADPNSSTATDAAMTSESAPSSAMMAADTVGGYFNTSGGDTKDMMSSSAALPSADTSHQFIRNADVRFRVKDVRTSTFSIEKITAKYEGYVASTHLNSRIDQVKSTPISEDSTLETTYYTVENNLTLRMPTIHLDSALRTMGNLVEYLDYRNITVTDVTLQTLANRLAARRLAISQGRLAHNVDTDDGKLRDKTATEEVIFARQTAADETLLANLQLKDQIKLSTVNVQIYQRQAVRREMIANDKNIDAYQPGFGHDLGQALEAGWNLLKALVIGMLNIWPVMIILITAAILLRRFLRKKPK
jgi:hypothetical protein